MCYVSILTKIVLSFKLVSGSSRQQSIRIKEIFHNNFTFN